MTSEYSIELQAENINNHKTKQYFQEVLSSYINKNYRSAIVVLWTIVVSDIIFKLQDLSSIHNDSAAEKILLEIKKKQEENKTSPEWEKELVKLIAERTQMFEAHEILHLETLQKQRHLCAHPILKEDLNLYQPNQELARSLIRNALEYILTKPSMASNKIFNSLLTDLQEKKDLFPDTESIENYLSMKYFSHMPKSVKQYVFKQLWKFVFKLNDENSKTNLANNLKALYVLYKQNTNDMNTLISLEKQFFSSNIGLDENMNLEPLVAFFTKYPKIFQLIDHTYHSPIISRIKQVKSTWAKAFFIYPNLNDYLQDLTTEIELHTIEKSKGLSTKILNHLIENGHTDNIIKLYIDCYARSKNYDEADQRFEKFIKPIIEHLNEVLCHYLLENIEQNNQTYNRSAALEEHLLIHKKCLALNVNFDFQQYSKFISSIEK